MITFYQSKIRLLNLQSQLLMFSFRDFAGNKEDLEDEETSLAPEESSSPPCININTRTSIKLWRKIIC